MTLRELRDRKGYSIKGVARFCGVSHITVWRWEKGIDVPETGRICTIARVLDATIEEVFAALGEVQMAAEARRE